MSPFQLWNRADAMFRRAARGVYRPMRPLRSAWFHEARSRRRRISR